MLKELFEKISTLRVMVVGDIMLDIYKFGKFTKISPEAPVPIFEESDVSYFAGGAANVAKNLQSLGADVNLISVVGEGWAGTVLERELGKVAYLQLIKDYHNVTTTKTRIINSCNQIMRIDRDCYMGYEDETYGAIGKSINNHMDIDVIIVSDYNHGVVCPRVVKAIINRLSLSDKKPIVVLDPKPLNYHASKHIPYDYITPNESEFIDLCNLDNKFRQTPFKTIVNTRGSGGVILFEDNGTRATEYSALNQKPIDVTGAGDTHLAAFSLAVAAGLCHRSSVLFANLASAIVVGKWGTSTVSVEEMLEQRSLIEEDIYGCNI